MGARPGPAVRRLPLFVRCLAIVLPLVALWAIATPLGAAPDEPEHLVTAQHLDSGHLLPGVEDTPAGRGAVIEVPGWLADATGLPSCYVFHPEISASCSPRLTSETDPKDALTQFTRYPPVYYAVIGLPTVVLSGPAAYWAVRLLSALLCVLLLTIGLELLLGWHPRRAAALVGATVALPPMTLFLSASATSSGVEVAAAFATTAGMLCLADRPGRPPRAITARLTIAATALVLSRPLSPLFLLVLVLSMLAITGRRRFGAVLRSAPRSLVALPGAAVAVAAGWIGVAGLPAFLGTPGPHMSFAGELHTTLARTGRLLIEQIGTFGWVDTRAPLLTIVAWASGVGALLILGFVRGRRRSELVAWLLPAVVALLLPVVLEAPRINTLGTFFQGRYCLPMSAAAMLILATRPAVADVIEGAAQRVRRAVAVLWFAGQAGAFLVAWHRYAVGDRGPLLPSHPAWQPPGGYVTVALFVAFAALIAVLIGTGGRAVPQPDAAPAMRGSPGARTVDRPARRPARARRPTRRLAALDDHLRRGVGRPVPPSPRTEPDR